MSCPCPTCSNLPPHPTDKGKHIDPSTGIYPIHEWGWECARGFVSNVRFSGGSDLVIKPTVRANTRKVYQALSAHPRSL